MTHLAGCCGKQCLREKMAKRGLLAVTEGSARRRQAETPFDCWIKAVVGHHGMPPEMRDTRLAQDFAEQDTYAALEFVTELITLLLPSEKTFPPVDKPQTKPRFMVAGRLDRV